MSASEHKRKYYPFLDGFRAMAVFGVLLHHIYIFFKIDIPLPLLEKIAHAGDWGVDMFFVISGFLITGLLLDALNGQVDIKRFYVRRFFKIYPQYLITIICGMILFAFIIPSVINGQIGQIKTHVPDTNLSSYFIFFQNYFPAVPTLVHTWSLVIEEQFYFFYPIILFFLTRGSRSPNQQRRLLITICVILILAGNLFRILYNYNGFLVLTFPFEAPVTMQTSLFRFDALAFGCLLRYCEPFYESLQGIRQKAFSIMAILLGTILYTILTFSSISEKGLPELPWYSYTIGYVAPGCLLLGAITGTTLFAENKTLCFLGRTSYGLYLWHYILIFPFALLADQCNNLVLIISYILMTLFVGIVTTKTIERFFLNIRSKICA